MGERRRRAGREGRFLSAHVTPGELFAGDPLALALVESVRRIVEPAGAVEIRTSKSQVAFRRRRGFAYLWSPGRYLASPAASVVLSIVLGRHDPSPRFKEVVHPAPGHWMHHLEMHGLDELDPEVTVWLLEAAERAG